MQWKGELLRKFLQEFLATRRINWPLLMVAAAEAVVERHHRRLPCCDCLSDWLSVSWISKWSCSLLCGYARACVPYVCVVFCGGISFWPWIRESRSCQPEAWLVIGVGWARLRTVQKRDQSQSSNNSSQMVERKGTQGNWMMDVSMNEWMGWIRWAFFTRSPPICEIGWRCRRLGLGLHLSLVRAWCVVFWSLVWVFPFFLRFFSCCSVLIQAVNYVCMYVCVSCISGLFFLWWYFWYFGAHRYIIIVCFISGVCAVCWPWQYKYTLSLWEQECDIRVDECVCVLAYMCMCVWCVCK